MSGSSTALPRVFVLTCPRRPYCHCLCQQHNNPAAGQHAQIRRLGIVRSSRRPAELPRPPVPCVSLTLPTTAVVGPCWAAADSCLLDGPCAACPLPGPPSPTLSPLPHLCYRHNLSVCSLLVRKPVATVVSPPAELQ